MPIKYWDGKFMKASEASNPEGTIELSGKVVEKKFAAGSKSEHDAVFLETDEGSYQLRRVGGNPFNDTVLRKLIGKKIIAIGTLHQSLFLAKQLKEDLQ